MSLLPDAYPNPDIDNPHRCMMCMEILDGHHTTCPECNATPPDTTLGHWVALFAGIGACFTIIGAIIGLPTIMWAAQRIRAGRHGRITEPHDA